MDGCMDGWLDGWMAVWMDGCMDGWIHTWVLYRYSFLQYKNNSPSKSVRVKSIQYRRLLWRMRCLRWARGSIQPLRWRQRRCRRRAPWSRTWPCRRPAGSSCGTTSGRTWARCRSRPWWRPGTCSSPRGWACPRRAPPPSPAPWPSSRGRTSPPLWSRPTRGRWCGTAAGGRCCAARCSWRGRSHRGPCPPLTPARTGRKEMFYLTTHSTH